MRDAIADYLAIGLALCRLRGDGSPSSAAAVDPGWTRHPITTLEQWDARPAPGVGVVHSASRTVCLDIDDPKTALPWLAERGIRDAVLSGWLWQGDRKRLKVLFRLPEGEPEPPYIAEVRGHGIGWRSGAHQDALPPTMHKSGVPYQWVRREGLLPVIPATVLAVWKELAAAQPALASGKVIYLGLDRAATGGANRMDYDPAPVLKGCVGLQHMARHPQSVSYEEWLAAAQVLSRCKDGDKVFHKLSALDPARYSPANTQAKFEHARDEMAPRTCANWPNQVACAGCAWRGRLTTPLNLEREANPAKPPEKAAEAPEIPFAGYRINAQGTQALVKDESDEDDGPKWQSIWPVPVWVERLAAIQEGNVSTMYVEMRINAQTVRVPASKLASEFGATMAAHGASVLHLSQKGVNTAKRYIGLWVAHYMNNITRIEPRLGWVGERFITPRETLLPTGEAEKVEVGDSILKDEWPLTGSAQGWIDAAKAFFAPGYEAQGIGLLMGLASPLVALSGEQSCTVALVGQSGQGKTTAQRAIASAFGGWHGMTTHAKDTENARVARMTTLNSYPLLFEEVTHLEPQRLSSFLLTASEGVDKARATKEGGLRARKGWQNVCVASSNMSVVETMVATGQFAAAMRVFELHVKLPQGADFNEGLRLQKELEANAGAFGETLLRYVVTHRDQIAVAIRHEREKLAQEVRARSEERYRLNIAACAVVMARIVAAKLAFDVTAIRAQIVELIRDMQQLASSSEAAPLLAVREFLRNNATEMVQVTSNENGTVQHLSSRNIRLPMGRIDYGKGEVAIAAGAIAQWLATKYTGTGVTYRQIVRELGVEKRVPLTAGTELADTGPIHSVVIPLDVINDRARQALEEAQVQAA